MPTQCVFVCFVRFSQQTGIVSPNSINRLGFVAETSCVSCKVRTEFLYIIWNKFIPQGAKFTYNYSRSGNISSVDTRKVNEHNLVFGVRIDRETELLTEYLPPYHSVYHKCYMT
jgi:hypothetical protein